jgi:hypothetical protein
LTDRWRTPAKVHDVVVDPDRFQVWPGRGVMADYEVSLDEDSMERVRLGRLCIECLEPFEEAFPETCPLCGFAVRDDQPERFEKVFKGRVHLGSRLDLNEEADRLAEEDARRKLKRSGVWLPNNPLA